MNYQLNPIIVAEDNDEDYSEILDVIQNMEIRNRVVRATDGEACLDILRGKHKAAVRPSLVLLDLNMPGIDGREVLTEIKTDPALKEIPVVIFTTSFNPEDVKECYERYANSYHLKPLSVTDFRKVMRKTFTYWLKTAVLPPKT